MCPTQLESWDGTFHVVTRAWKTCMFLYPAARHCTYHIACGALSFILFTVCKTSHILRLPSLELVSYFSESITGITYIKNDRRVSQFLRNPDVKHSYESLEMHEEIAEPTARLVAEGKLETTFFERDTNKKTK
jgi:hypothetical protein